MSSEYTMATALQVLSPTAASILNARTTKFDDEAAYEPFDSLLGDSLVQFAKLYEGSHPFLANIGRSARDGRILTINQKKAIANAVWYSIRKAEGASPNTPTLVPVPPAVPAFAPPPPTATPASVPVSASFPTPSPQVIVGLEVGSVHDNRPATTKTLQCYTCKRWVVGEMRDLLDHKRLHTGQPASANPGYTPRSQTAIIERTTMLHNIDLRSFHDGRFAVEVNGEWKYYLITKMKRRGHIRGRFQWGKNPRGYQYLEIGDLTVREQRGDTKKFIGCQLLADDHYFGEQEEAILEIARDPAAAMQNYGRRMKSCAYCGRSLTDFQSQARGIGPDCWEDKHVANVYAIRARVK